MSHRRFRVTGRSVQPGTNCGSTEVHFQQELIDQIQIMILFPHEHGIRAELLTNGHWHGILQLGAAHLQDVGVLIGFHTEGIGELVELLAQALDLVKHSDAESARIGIVGGLALVDVVVGIDHIVAALLEAHGFQGEVGDHLVHIHVGAGAGTALKNILRELIHATAFIEDEIAGLDDGIGDVLAENSFLEIGEGTGFLHHYQAANKLWMVIEFAGADLEIVEGSLGVYTVVGISRDFEFAQQVFFDTRLDHRADLPLRRISAPESRSTPIH